MPLIATSQSFGPLGRGISRGVELLRAEGFSSLFFRILDVTVYRRLWVMERSLERAPPRVPLTIPLKFGRLAEADLGEFLTFRQAAPVLRPGHAPEWCDSPEALARRRLASDHECFLARHEGRIVSASWVARVVGPVPYLDCDLSVGADTIYVYDSFTDPDWRGKNVSPALGADLISRFHRLGWSRVVVAVLPENHASRRARAKLGFEPCGRIGYFGTGRWKRHFCQSSSCRIQIAAASDPPITSR